MENLTPFNKALLASHYKEFSEIKQMAREALQFLNERRIMQENMDNFTTTIKNGKEQNDLYTFNVVTQKMIIDTGASSGKRHRLQKEKVEVLEAWYTKNSSNPYLNDSIMKSLMELTGLTKVQIRNW